MTKRCGKCNSDKDEAEFNKRASSKDGLNGVCKECKNHRARELHAANPQIQHEAYRRYVERHPDRYKESRRNSEQKHKEKRNEYRKRWRQARPEKTKEYADRWVSKEENRRKKLELSKAWNHANPEKMREISKRWRGKNPDTKRASNHRRKYRLKGAIGTYTAQEWQDLCDYYGNICLRCKANTQLTVDHVVPIALGGSNSIDNIQPLCLSCNCSKQDTIADYRY